MNEINYPQSYQQTQHPLVKIGLFALGIYVLDNLISEKNDTINYSLWYRNELVYHGICFADRLQARLYEHEMRGLVFSEYDYDRSKTRLKALAKEKMLIQRDKPKYNFHHSY